MNILVTGATGFLGGRLCKTLNEEPRIRLTAVVRRGRPVSRVDSVVQMPCIDSSSDWTDALRAQEVVVHTAARAHVMNDSVVDSLLEYRKINVEGALNLARQSAAAGVKRFVFISSIKVNGEQTAPGQRFQPEDEAKPIDPYGISKWEAEHGLQQIANDTGMEVVIIRPPLVYGPGVKGNFAYLINLMGKGLPLPLGAIYNQRSLVALDNLVDLIIICLDHPNAANQVFLVSDGQDLSTTELLQGLARAMGRPSRLLPLPRALLSVAASLLGKTSVADRLLSSLQVDISKTDSLLGWTPPITIDEGLRRCFES